MEGGWACWLASKKEYVGMVLISPFESTYRTVTGVPISPGDRLMNFDRIVGMKEPFLIVHGSVNKAIPRGYSESLFELLPFVGKEFSSINGGCHNDLLVVASNEIFRPWIDWPRRWNEEAYLLSRIAWSS